MPLQPASDELVERERELAAVDAALESARSGTGRILMLEGPGGIGKTSVLEEAARHAAAGGFDVLRARGSELEREVAFGVALQLFQRRALRADPDERRTLLAGAASLAEPLLAATGEPPAGQAVTHGLFWLASNMAAERPLLLCVDDAHVVDAPSLAFLRYLAQRLEDVEAVVCLTARPGEAGANEGVLGGLRAHPATVPLDVQPLSRGGVGWLVAAQGFAGAAPAFVDACADATGGNPFYLRELLRVLRAQEVGGTAEDAPAVRSVGPQAVAKAVWLALSHLGPEGTALARAVAVLGDGVATGTAAALARLGDATATTAAAALARAEVLQAGDGLAFVHPVVRAAVYDDLRPLERAYAHNQAARLLCEAGAAPEEVSSHLLATGEVGEPWAAGALRSAAARSLAGGDPAAAGVLLHRLLDEPLADDERGRALVDLGRAEAAAGAPGAAERFEDGVALLNDPAERAQVHLFTGRSLHETGRYSEATEAFSRGLAESGIDPALEADLRSGWANSALFSPEIDPETQRRAMETIAGIGKPATAGERIALANLAGSYTLRGTDHRAAVELATRAWGDGALLAEAGPEEPAYFSLAPALGWGDEVERARQVYAAVADEARQRGLVKTFATAMYGVGGSHFFAGELPEAIAALESAFDAERYGWGQFITGAYWFLGRCLVERGELDAADRLLTFTPEREAELAATPDFLVVHGVRGHVRLARGDAVGAVVELERAAQLPAMIGVANPAFFPWRPAMIRALAATGDRARAVEIADEQLDLARQWGAASAIGRAIADRALLDDEPIAQLRAAADRLAASPTRLEHAHVLVDLGAALRSVGDVDEAQAVLREGRDLAERCGALALVARAGAEIVAAGGRLPGARTTGAAALTPAELRVARMAADGRTNREIAEDLFVTVKAVKFHLGNAYRKLGIASRAELAGALSAPS